MSGSLAVPNTFTSQAGNVPASQLDNNNSAITTYVNAREITLGTLGARPTASVAGRLYCATDTNGGTLYEDSGTAWTQIAGGVLRLSTLAKSVVPVSLSNTTSESYLYSATVAAGVMTSTGILRVTLAGHVLDTTNDATNTAQVFTMRLKFGASTAITEANLQTAETDGATGSRGSATTNAFKAVWLIQNPNDATNQFHQAVFDSAVSDNTVARTGTVIAIPATGIKGALQVEWHKTEFGVTAINTTAATTITITGQWTRALTTSTFTADTTTVELL